MFKFRKRNSSLHGFVKGKVISVEKVKDPVFSQKLMGDGFAIEPMEDEIFSPVSGEVTVVFPTLHAYGIKMETGVEVLLHLGLDTVKLKGEGFDSFVKVGDKVKQGDLIAHMNLDFLRQNSIDTTSICIITSGESISLKEKDIIVNKDIEIATINH